MFLGIAEKYETLSIYAFFGRDSSPGTYISPKINTCDLAFKVDPEIVIIMIILEIFQFFECRLNIHFFFFFFSLSFSALK